uniref:Uncharacterized protein n=1 Tax=Fagus sylvatica TaxID=28930 RepID=A0A2N9FTG3_FAGSY
MMGFRSSGIETTSSWSLWKTTREFIEKARRAAVVDGGLATKLEQTSTILSRSGGLHRFCLR